jgi:magnesium transporter
MGKKKRKNIGLSPGTLEYLGQKSQECVIDRSIYSEDSYQRDTFLSKVPSNNLLPNKILWLDVQGLKNTSIIAELGASFQIHPLILEDILNVSQRPKYVENESGSFFITHHVCFRKLELSFHEEQISIFFNERMVVTFREESSNLFEPIYKRLDSVNKLRRSGADYLAYAIMDLIIDHYFVVMDEMEEEIEIMEDIILENPEMSKHRSAIFKLKRETTGFRKYVFPLREALNDFLKSDTNSLSPASAFYWKDLYDHSSQVLDAIETNRVILQDLNELHLGELDNRNNTVVKTLTIISTIFIPLTFIVGVYGMNFDNMPELRNKNGYYIIMAVMLSLSTGMVIYFKRKKWM